MDYRPQDLDRKWQERWASSRAFEVTVDQSRPKFYCLEMFAYPSGHAHVGHVRNYIIGDVMARTKRMRGYNVLHPFGWDAFGLPAENAAIKGGIHPEVSTRDNIAHMKGQLQRLGISYAWERELATCDAEYYKWNQWLFIRMFERGLAYRRRSSVNWCPSCNTVLANEQVVDGGCWRCGTPVEMRDLEQWFFRITAYADELLDATAGLTGWPDKVLTMQRNWIGRSEGARVKFADRAWSPEPRAQCRRALKSSPPASTRSTVRRSYCWPPSIRSSASLRRRRQTRSSFRQQVQAFRAQDRAARMSGAIEKQGFDTGARATNPFTGELVPVWVANFVLGEYGTGAVMGVPAHDQRDFEFARKFDLPIRVVVTPDGRSVDSSSMTEAAEAYGTLVDAGEYSGLPSAEAQKRMIAAARERGRRRRHRPVPSEGLGYFAPAILGYADSHDPLSEGRCRARAGRGSAGCVAARHGVQRARRFAAGAGGRFRQRALPEVRRSGQARDRHDGHLRGLVVVLLPVCGPAE